MKSVDYFYDNPSSGKGRFSQVFCTAFMALVRVIFKLLFRYKAHYIHKLEQLDANQGFILVGNHCSYLDPLFTMAVLRPRPIRYIAKEEFLNANKIIGRLAAWVGVFPVKRNSADMLAFKRAVRMLKRGEIVGIFPEGTRVRSKDQVVKNHDGAALIAQLSKTPVVPVRLFNTEKISPKGKFFFRCPKIELVFGDVMSIEDEAFASLPKQERYTAFTAAVMDVVYSLETPTAKD